MSRLRHLCLACLYASLSPTAANAAPLSTLTLADAIALALRHNPDSLATDEDVRGAQGALVQSHALPNPSLFVGALGTNLSPIDAPIPNQVGVSWTIPIGGKRSAGIDSARAAVDAASATRVSSRRQLAFDVETAFIAVLEDQAQLDFAKEDQRGLRAAVDLDQIRYKDGKIAYGDVLKVRIQSRGADDTVRQRELALATDRAELARLVGEGVLEPTFTLAGTLVAPPSVVQPSADLLDHVLAQRSDYQALAASERSADAALTQARRQPIPDLGVTADYNHIPDMSGTFDVILTASIPLFDRNRGNTVQADAAHRKARLAIASLRAQIRSDLAVAIKGVEISRARLEVYEHGLLADAKESLEISTHAYQEGRGTLLDYLDAEASHREVESEYRSAVAAAMLAAAKLRFVSGEELP
jgi:cobalt-zinc-cadmium efflux system outer membrane protein